MDIFTIAIEFTVIGFAALTAIDLGSRLGAMAAKKAVTDTITPATTSRPIQRPTAPAEYTVEYIAYCGETHTIKPAPVTTQFTTDDWMEANAWERPMPPRRILGDVIKSKSANKLSDLIRSEAARPKDGIVDKVDHTFNLPANIRGLRQYVRDNGLQAAVKAQLGKTVSKATKDELIAALGTI
jgi:hypothetical protein